MNEHNNQNFNSPNTGETPAASELPKKRRRGCTCLVAMLVTFVIVVLAGGGIAYAVGNSFTTSNLDVRLIDVFAVSRDLRRRHDQGGDRNFTLADREAFERHVTRQLFLNDDVEIPYDELFDLVLDMLLGGEDGGILPFNTSDSPYGSLIINSLNDHRTLSRQHASTIEGNSFMGLLSNILVRENINVVALEAFSPDNPHNFILTASQLGAFLDEIFVRGLYFLVQNYTPSPYGINMVGFLEELSIQRVRFTGTERSPYLQITVRTGVRQIVRNVLANVEVLPGFVSNFLTWLVLPEYVYLVANVGLAEYNTGLAVSVNDLDIEQMDRFFNLIDGFVDFSSTGLSVADRTASLQFMPSDLATTINNEANYLLSPIMVRVGEYLIFDNIENGTIGADLFGTLVAISGINYDYNGNLLPNVITSSDFILSLRFFVLREAGLLENTASVNYDAAIDALSDALFLTDAGRESFSQLLSSADMNSFDPNQFNIRGALDGDGLANSIAHDLRTVEELQIFVADSDFAAILRDRLIGNLILDVPYLSLVALHSAPYPMSTDLSEGNIFTSFDGTMGITFRIDLAEVFADLDVPFLAALVIDALYIDIVFNINDAGIYTGEREDNSGYYYYYYSASIYINNLPLDNMEIQSILNIVRFFSDTTFDVEDITRAAGREIFRFFYEVRTSWFSQNIMFGARIDEFGDVQKGLVIGGLFDMLAGTTYGTDAFTLLNAIQGMFSVNDSAVNPRNFNRDYLIVSPIGEISDIDPSVWFGLSFGLGATLTDYEMGAVLTSDFIKELVGGNSPFVCQYNRFSLVQLRSVSTTAYGEVETARLYFTFRLDVLASYYLVEGSQLGFSAFMPETLYFTFMFDWGHGLNEGYRYSKALCEAGRSFKINNLTAAEQAQLLLLTGYDYSTRILEPINTALSFMNMAYMGLIMYGDGIAVIP